MSLFASNFILMIWKKSILYYFLRKYCGLMKIIIIMGFIVHYKNIILTLIVSEIAYSFTIILKKCVYELWKNFKVITNIYIKNLHCVLISINMFCVVVVTIVAVVILLVFGAFWLDSLFFAGSISHFVWLDRLVYWNATTFTQRLPVWSIQKYLF